ncbi:hypothetical protein A3D70_00535 [Candidatus Adlerbacteria bacterium RIFCSPHIGHO2_02_FULL_54_18]|uniref:Zinc/iron permease n=2 Tax=Candidatus Adleribacteriota TaxID=1752736 RepID=A0A1F4Y1V1_9BACT|nr:MAG: hypothetical protein A2949_02795 [Candidatus Adlerbacteria bacterium RIFCSPLOWO2_01_FULL_54_21b]OGC87766.1 MAG: hypothetical protein A3D70_00535 [Candidatus Adlerbacteria bacterium RIFCSPHIGHO2_02_FULL_54_18]
MSEILLASALVMLASIVGIVSVWRSAGAALERNLHFLISFSAGVFIVFAYGLAREGIEHSGSTTVGLLWMFGGALFVWVAFKFMPGLHQHEVRTTDHDHEHAHLHLDPRRMLLTDSVHNAADGIFLAAAFATGSVFGWAAALSIFVHEVLQEISEYFVLRDAGYSVGRALRINFATSATIMVGAVGGYFLLDTFEMLEGPLLAVAAGGVMVVVLHDLIPHSVREAVSATHYLKHLTLFVVGAGLMAGVTALVPHVELEHIDTPVNLQA